jgi:hypothetical protein
MKHLKIIGLAAVAVGALMAFAGSGTASADEICTENVNPCPEGKRITTLDYSLSGSATFEQTDGTPLLTCTTGRLHEDITAQGAGIAIAKDFTTFSLSNCGGTVDTIRAGSGDINNNGGSNGTDVDRETEVTFITFSVSCTYGTGTGTDRGTLKGGSGAKLSINAVLSKTAGSFLCPSTIKWTGDFVLTNHTAAFVINN